MESNNRTNKALLIALIISLLLHIGLIFYILLQKTEGQHTPITLPPQPKEIPWAATKAGGSNHPAPVLFQNPHTPLNKTETTIEPHKEATQEQESPRPDEQHTEKQNNASETTTPVTTPEKNTTFFKRQKFKTKPKSTLPSPSNSPQQTSSPSLLRQPKQLPTLAQLAQGFMNRVNSSNGKGHHLVSMIGAKGQIPTDEQIKYERYLQKFDHCVTNSMVINHEKFPRLTNIDDDIWIVVSLNRDGTLKSMNLKKSSNNRMLDAFILFIMQDASSSFPPVPNYLPDDPFTFTLSFLAKSLVTWCRRPCL